MLGTDLMEETVSRHQLMGVDRNELDIKDRGQCARIVDEYRPAAVINAAALTQVDYCESHQEEAFRINGEGAGNLASAAAAVGALMVHYSTDYVFDGSKPEAYEEEDAPAPRSIYGRSKLLAEKLVREICPAHAILRTSWLFGRNGTNFIRTIVDAARRGQELRVVNDQRGSPTFSLDLARCTLRMIESECRGLYHVTNGGSCTWYELTAYVLAGIGLPDARLTPVSTEEFPRPAPRPANSVLANSRLAREGLLPMRPWRDAVREYIRYL